MKIVFLDAGTFYDSPNVSQMLSSLGDLVLYDYTSDAEIVARICDAEIVITNKVVLKDDTFAQCNRLKMICVTATGMNNIDLEAATQRGIVVKNASSYSTHSVAQTTLAMALQLLIQLPSYQLFVQKKYSGHPFFTHLNPSFSEINGKTWGIIGLGNIGKQVAKIVEAFGGKVVYHSPSGRNLDAGYPHLALSKLLITSDIISIHTPLNEFSRNLIGIEELELCKRTAILINVARGGIVNETALAQSIEKDEIAGAAVDVFAVEPILAYNPLLQVSKKKNLILTPHIAWGSEEARQTLMEITCRNIQEYMGSK